MVTTSVTGVWILLAISLCMLTFLLWTISRLMSQQKSLKAKVNRNEFEMANQMVEEERTRIAAELHDDLGSGLSIVHLNLEIVTQEASSLTPIAQGKLHDACIALNDVLNIMRNSVWNLSAQMFDDVDLGLAIRELCRKHDNPRGARVTYIQSGMISEMTKEFRLNVFRITQELLVNCTRHAAAREIGVHVHCEAGVISVTINDDGIHYKKPRGLKGVGLLSISRRVAHIGATLERTRFSNGNRVSLVAKIP